MHSSNPTTSESTRADQFTPSFVANTGAVNPPGTTSSTTHNSRPRFKASVMPPSPTSAATATPKIEPYDRRATISPSIDRFYRKQSRLEVPPTPLSKTTRSKSLTSAAVRRLSTLKVKATHLVLGGSELKFRIFLLFRLAFPR